MQIQSQVYPTVILAKMHGGSDLGAEILTEVSMQCAHGKYFELKPLEYFYAIGNELRIPIDKKRTIIVKI